MKKVRLLKTLLYYIYSVSKDIKYYPTSLDDSFSKILKNYLVIILISCL